MFPEPPEGYRESEAKQILEQYADTDIPDDQKITVVGIMLEAFSDLSDFPQLNEISAVRNLYEPLHELESRSVSGNLLTNIFAGGTTNTESSIFPNSVLPPIRVARPSGSWNTDQV